MIIACDVDNVLNNLQETVVKLFNERYGTNYTLNDFHNYKVANVLPVKEAVDMKEMYGENEIYDHVRPIVGSQEGLQKLINGGDDVYLVTDAIPKNYNEKITWLHHFFPFIDNAHIVALKHKNLFKCDIMIEDNPHNLLASCYYDRICMDYPWNRQLKDHVYGIYRCNGWDQIVDAVNKIKEE